MISWLRKFLNGSIDCIHEWEVTFADRITLAPKERRCIEWQLTYWIGTLPLNHVFRQRRKCFHIYVDKHADCMLQ